MSKRSHGRGNVGRVYSRGSCSCCGGIFTVDLIWLGWFLHNVVILHGFERLSEHIAPGAEIFNPTGYFAFKTAVNLFDVSELVSGLSRRLQPLDIADLAEGDFVGHLELRLLQLDNPVEVYDRLVVSWSFGMSIERLQGGFPRLLVVIGFLRV